MLTWTWTWWCCNFPWKGLGGNDNAWFKPLGIAFAFDFTGGVDVGVAVCLRVFWGSITASDSIGTGVCWAACDCLTSFSSCSSKQLTDGTARKRSTSRKGTKNKYNEPEEGQSKQRAVSVDEENPKEETRTKRRAVSVDTGKNMLRPSQIGIQAMREALENAKKRYIKPRTDFTIFNTLRRMEGKQRKPWS